MNLATLLAARNGGGQPIRIGLIGAGKFGSMILSQVQHVAGLHVVGIADLDVAKAQAALARVGCPRSAAPRRPWRRRCARAQPMSATMAGGCSRALASRWWSKRPATITGLRHGLAATDASDWYASMWSPFHLSGRETAITIAAAVLRRGTSAPELPPQANLAPQVAQ